VECRFCDERGAAGFSWVVDEPATRTSHALASGGRVWLVDPVGWPEALDRARSLGEPAGVLQLLDRHGRDCAEVAGDLGVPHLVVPRAVPGAPFEVVDVRSSWRWHEVALWSPSDALLVVAESIGTNAFYTGGGSAAGVHLLARLRPPRAELGRFTPQHLLVGHGEGLHGPAAADALAEALRTARTGLLRVTPRVPGLLVDAYRRRA
jgi:hypothetical protein